MNKRQSKKRKRKSIPVIADEMNLLLMTDEERIEAYEDYEKFKERYTLRKKYKNIKGKFIMYYFPIGEKAQRELQEITNMFRKFNFKLNKED